MQTPDIKRFKRFNPLTLAIQPYEAAASFNTQIYVFAEIFSA